MILNGSEIIVECLKEQGVDTVFGYPGGAILNVYDALYKHSERLHIYLHLMSRGHHTPLMVMQEQLEKLEYALQPLVQELRIL